MECKFWRTFSYKQFQNITPLWKSLQSVNFCCPWRWLFAYGDWRCLCSTWENPCGPPCEGRTGFAWLATLSRVLHLFIVEYQVGRDLGNLLVQPFLAKARSRQGGPATCPAESEVSNVGESTTSFYWACCPPGPPGSFPPSCSPAG